MFARLSRSFVLVVAVVAGVLTWRTCRPLDVFWITDVGNRYIQVQNWVYSGYSHVAIAYPAADIDPSFHFFPYAGGHFLPRGNGFYSIVPFQWPLLNAPLYAALGPVGLLVVPLASFAGTLVALVFLLRATETNDSSALTVLLTAVATPLAFYAATFWEHTTATFCATLAGVFLVRALARTRGQAILAGLALGAAIFWREEAYVLLAAVIITLVTHRTWRRCIPSVLVGCLIVSVPMWVVQWRIYGHPLGLHLMAHASPESPGEMVLRMIGNVAYFLLRFHASTLIATLLAIPVLATLVVGALRGRPIARAGAVLVGGISACVGVAFVMRDPQPFENTAVTQGLFLAVPILLVLLAAWRDVLSDHGPNGLLGRVVFLYIGLLPLVLRANWSGLVWGPRYFLLILPLAIPPTIVACRSVVALPLPRRVGITGLVILVVASVVLQGFGLFLQDEKLRETAALRDLIANEPTGVIMTDIFWLPEEMASVFFRKRFMMPRSPNDLPRAIRVLADAGVTEFTFAASPRYGWRSPEDTRLLQKLAINQMTFASRRIPLLTVILVHCRVPDDYRSRHADITSMGALRGLKILSRQDRASVTSHDRDARIANEARGVGSSQDVHHRRVDLIPDDARMAVVKRRQEIAAAADADYARGAAGPQHMRGRDAATAEKRQLANVEIGVVRRLGTGVDLDEARRVSARRSKRR
ncbi:MAG: glycosyltransferase family 39 protein [Acidobacteriota bacterium]|nr:glycosyltransferase family 39 protein [Acidobacteriota bacterium]